MLALDTERNLIDATDAVFRYGVEHGLLHAPKDVQRDYATFVARAIVAGRNAPVRLAVNTKADAERETRACGEHVGQNTPGAIGAQVMLDAETGTGKTIGYLIPLLLDVVRDHTTGRVCVSTYTIALQQQIMDGDLPRVLDAVEGVTGYRPTVALRLGMSNFVDPERARGRLADLAVDTRPVGAEQKRLRKALANWLDVTLADPEATGQLADFGEKHAGEWPRGAEPHKLCVNGDSTKRKKPGKGADDNRVYGRMFYDRSCAKAAAADMVITNHATVLYDTLRHGALLGGANLPLRTFVFDEADRIESAAASIDSGSVSLEALRGDVAGVQELFAQTTDPLLGKTAPGAVLAPLASAVDALIGAANALNERAAAIDVNNPNPSETIVMLDHPNLPPEKVAALIDATRTVGETAKPLFKYARKAALNGSLPAVMESAIARIGNVQAFGDTAARQLELDAKPAPDGKREAKLAVTDATPLLAVRWSPRRKYPTLRYERLYPARLLSRRWTLPRTVDSSKVDPVPLSVIFTSATLAVRSLNSKKRDNRLFDSFCTALALLDEHRNPGAGMHHTFAPETFGNAAFLYADANAPRPFVKEDEEAEEDVAGVDATHPPNPAWIDYAVAMILHARKTKPKQRALVLPTSFLMGEMLADGLIAAGCPHVVLRQRGESPKAPAVLKEVRAHDDSVYVAAGCWEGFEDVEGSKGRKHNVFGIVVASKIPFLPPQPVREHGLERVLKAHGRNPHDARGRLINENFGYAQRRLRQGFGRGIRNEKDKVYFVICDPRFPAPAGLQPEVYRNPAYANIMAAIPERFRDPLGDYATVDDGEVFRVPTVAAVKR
ncbi:MAG TPA: helicase C-terminal domain-containing protein [Rhodanobacteraceae bacterium]